MSEKLPDVVFKCRENGEWVDKSTIDLFLGKKAILFSLPGAFTPTCTNYQLPGYDQHYDRFKEAGIDEIYCVSVNDTFVMNAWAEHLGIKKVKMIPDGNGEFTRRLGMLVKKEDIGFGMRSWRYAAIVKDGIIENVFVEEGRKDNNATDPYEHTKPETLYTFITENK